MSIISSIGLGDKSLIQKWLEDNVRDYYHFRVSEKDLSIQIYAWEISKNIFDEYFCFHSDGILYRKSDHSMCTGTLVLDVDDVEKIPSYIKFSKNIEVNIISRNMLMILKSSKYPNLFVDTIETKVEVV